VTKARGDGEGRHFPVSSSAREVEKGGFAVEKNDSASFKDANGDRANVREPQLGASGPLVELAPNA